MMKRSVFFVLLTLGLLLGIGSNAWGYGVFGPTDLMYTPTAATLEAGALGISIDLSEGDWGYFNFDYGLFDDLEAGILIFTDNHGNNEIRIRGKYAILLEDHNTPGLAVGIEDLGSANNLSPYLVLSKSFSNAVQGHIGVGGGNFHGIFGGLEVSFARGSGAAKRAKKALLFLEADAYGINAGARFGIGANTKINFGLSDLQNWMAGVTFIVD